MSIGSDGWLDLTHPLHPQLPTWEDAEPIEISTVCEIGPDGPARVSRIGIGSHNGTHLDAPSHFIPDGPMVEDIPLNVLIGRAWVAEAGEASLLTEAVLESLAIPAEATRVLLRTSNTSRGLMSRPRFERDFAGLDDGGARWILSRGIRLVGIDYLSVQAFAASDETHRILLGAATVLVEGLDLSRVSTGWYDLVCLPLSGRGLDGAPARVVARPA